MSQEQTKQEKEQLSAKEAYHKHYADADKLNALRAAALSKATFITPAAPKQPTPATK